MDDDYLIFDVKGIARAAMDNPCPTKREVASVVGRTYNPLGILAPLITPFCRTSVSPRSDGMMPFRIPYWPDGRYSLKGFMV